MSAADRLRRAEGRSRTATSARDARRGVAAILAVVALVVMGALVTGGLVVAARQARIGYGEAKVAAAFYAAESGLSATFAAWDPGAATTLAPGTTRPAWTGRLATGDAFDAWLTRLDDGANDRHAFYLLTSTGRAHGAFGGLRQLGLLLRSPDPSRWCCEAAVTAAGDLRLEGDGAILGLGTRPGAWLGVPDLCEAHESPRAGLLTDSRDRLRRSREATIEGAPQVRALPAGRLNVTHEVESAFWELVGQADIVLPRGTRLDSVAAGLDAGGHCTSARRENWGAPLEPDHPCFDFLPVIVAEGDLAIGAAGRGQGILLVTGDLDVLGGFEFYGTVIVLGATWLRGGRIFGSLLALGAGGVTLTDGGQVAFSECAISRALRSAKLVLPHPLAQFSWLEILE
jgi:hypothetical protein